MKLDIACGHHKTRGWTGMDIQRLPDVDIVHDINLHPWPIAAESVEQAKAWHIVEHIPPTVVTERGTRFPFIEFMDECWRVLRSPDPVSGKMGAQLDIECPHGASDGFIHDPTHCNMIDELTFEYFTPDSRRYQVFQPKPWKIIDLRWTRDGNINVILEKEDFKEPK